MFKFTAIMRRRFLIMLTLLLCAFCDVHAFTKKQLDSLQSVWQNDRAAAAERVRALFVTHFDYDDENPAEALRLASLCDSISLATGFATGRGMALQMEANALVYLGRQTESLVKRRQGVALVEKNFQPQQVYFLAVSYRYLASILANNGQKDSAWMIVEKAIALLENRREPAELLTLHHNLAEASLRQGETARAADYINRGIELGRTLNYRRLEPFFYLLMAESFKTNSNPEKELEYIQKTAAALPLDDKAIRISRMLTRLGDYFLLHNDTAACLRTGHQLDSLAQNDLNKNITIQRNAFWGKYFMRYGQQRRAVAFVLKNVDANRSLTWGVFRFNAYMEAGDAYTQLQQHQLAWLYYDSALAAARQNPLPLHLAKIYLKLAQNAETSGQRAAAYDYLKKHKEWNERYIAEDNRNKMSDLEARYQSSLKEAQITGLKKDSELEQRRTSFFILLSCIFVLLALTAAWALRQKSRNNRLLAEKNAIINRQIEKLYELNQEKNALMGMVSHDLAGPMSNISVWAQLLGRKNDNFTERQKEAAVQISRAARQGQQLISTILSVEKAGTGQHQLLLEQFSVPQLLSTLYSTYQPSADLKQIRFELLLPDSDVCLLSDATLVSRIVENLVTNAIKFTHAGRNVWLRLHENSHEITIAVQDEGPGIPAAEIPLLFSPFSNLSVKPTAGEKSNGLGLSIVKRLADELNAQLHVESETGKGSSFTVTFKK